MAFRWRADSDLILDTDWASPLNKNLSPFKNTYTALTAALTRVTIDTPVVSLAAGTTFPPSTAAFVSSTVYSGSQDDK